MTDTETAWLAGIFDGEGCIVWVHKDRPRPTPRLNITNTNYELLLKIIEVAGIGNLVAQPNRNPDRHADAWNWQCYGGNARILLRQMLPWLIVKRERALQALQ